ncbi:MAG: hypothetical protein IJL05_04265 [Alphaproteobacteria bacterium]|nr:hypothetical protein [Alphaproteobacteria bacterium]
MKIVENIKKHLSKLTDDKNIAVVNILFIYACLVMLGIVYDARCHDSDKCQPETLTKHTATSEITGKDYGTVIAVAKEQDGHCEYRACDDKTCDWYDNSNRECDGINKGEWIARVENRTYKGISLCSATKGEFAKPGNPSRKTGAYCWCKSGKNWVSDMFLITPSYCSNNGCAGNCAHGVLYSPIFRSVLNSKVQRAK